jgi:WD40 repeat protein
MSDQQVVHTPIALYCSYADADQRLKQELEKHLKILLDQHIITFWSHDQIQLGSETAQVMERQLHSASVVFLLLSPDYFNSDQCQREVVHALERQRTGTARVFLILVRPYSWEMETRLQGLPVLPEQREPVTLWRNRDQAWLAIVRGLCQRLHLETSAFAVQRPAIFEARDLPSTYVPRPTEFNAVKRLLLSETSTGTPAAITTALRGAGGFGKTTLAQALCHDPDIQATYADGILWLTLGETPPNPLSLLNTLITSFTEKRPNYNTLEHAAAKWRSLLSSRSCLIVLDDIWPGIDLTPLLEGGPHCARLLTTRDTSVLPATSQPVPVDAMREAEALQLLCQGLPTSIQQPSHAAILVSIVKDLGEWPLLLTLANAALKERINNNQDLSEALTDLHEDYEAEGVVAFDKANTRQRNAAIERSLTASLKLLNASDSLRYQELAIFPEDLDIPLATIEKLWQATAGLDQRKVKKLCLRLSSLSLLLSCDLRSSTIRLHDVLRNYLQQKAAANLTHLHYALLNAYHLPTWADLPSEEPYLWQHLFSHLKAAGQTEELLTTAQDLRYLAKKAFLLGSSPIEADLQEAKTLAPHNQSLARLHSRIIQIAHRLNRSETWLDTQCLFLNYLCDLEHYREQCTFLERHIDGVYVKACHPVATLFSSMLYRTLEGHTEVVYACAISADGSFIVSASHDGTLIIWDRQTGEILHTLQGHKYSVNACAISTDGSFIVSASWDETLIIWDRQTGEILHTLQGHKNPVKACAISTDGSFIVSASWNEILIIWDRQTGEILHTLRGHRNQVAGCAISADGRFIVSASYDRTLIIWDRLTGQAIRTLQGHTDRVEGCAISADGRFIVSASFDKTLIVWDRLTGEILHTLQGHRYWINGCAISSDGSFIVSASSDKTLIIWDRLTGQALHSPRGHRDQVNGCAISSDGSFIVSASNDGTLIIWDRLTGEILHTLQGHRILVTGCAISADDRFIVSVSYAGTLIIWDRLTGEILHTLRGVYTCAISTDGSFIVSTLSDKTLIIWDRLTGQAIRTLQGHTERAEGCAISTDGSFIVSASFDQTLIIWDRLTGQAIRTLQGHTDGVEGCAISTDGRFIVSASWDKTLKVWETQSGRCLCTLPLETLLRDICFSSGSPYFAIAGDAGVYFFELVQGNTSAH